MKKAEGSWWWKMDFHCFSSESVYSNLGTRLESWQWIGEEGYFLVIYQFTELCKYAVSNWHVECLLKVSGMAKNKTPVTPSVSLNPTRLNNSPQKKFQFFLDIPKRHFGHLTVSSVTDPGILSRKLKWIKLFFFCVLGGRVGSPVLTSIVFLIPFFNKYSWVQLICPMLLN